MLQNQAKQGTRKCSSGTASGGKLSIDMIQSMRSIDLPEKKDRHHEPSDDPAAAGPTQQPKIPDDVEKIVEVPATPPATDFAPKRRLSESGTTMTTSSSCGHLTSLGGDGSGDAGTDAPALPAAPESPRPVVKRSNSLGHLTTFLLGRGDDDENNDIESSGNSDQQKHATTGLLQKLGLRRNTMEHHQTAISGDVLDMSGRGGDVNAMPPPAPSRKIKAAAKFHHRCTMEDSIHVQKRHNTVLDDEKHEENPHLKDYLKPKQFVHISKRESQDNLLHLETQYLRPKVKPMVVAEEESSDEENENDDLLPSASPVSDVDVDADTAASTDADEMDVERTEVHDEPVTAVAHKEFDPNEPLRSCVKKAWGQDTEARKPKKNVDFHEVTVREYGITLGDHPNVSYGPPITLSWDYLEYDPLNVDDYEIHHPKRRTLRQMGLNYYQRRNLLLFQTDYTEEELRSAWKSVKKIKQQRYITKNYTSAFPLRLVEDACQSAVRKVKRTISSGSKRSSS